MIKFLKYIFAYFQKDNYSPISIHEIFISSGTPKYTRIEIEENNQILENFVNSPNEHLLIHGPSKSGKSTLWESKLGKDKVIKIPCSFKMTLMSLYSEIIDELDVFYKSSQTVSNEIKVGFETELKPKIQALEQTFKNSMEAKTSTSDKIDRMVPPT